MPKYIIKDAEYTLDESRIVKVSSKELAYDYPEIYVSEDGGDFNRKIDRKDFSTTSSNSVQLQYRYNGSEVYTSDIIPVKDVNFKNKLDKTLYFDNQNMNVAATPSSIVLENNGDNACSTFINPLNFSTFSASFDLAGSDLLNAKFELIFTDYEDENNIFKIAFYTKSEKNLIYILLNDEVELSAIKSSYTISYDALKGMIKDSFENQALFDNPFKSDRFYLSFRYVDVKGTARVALTSLSGQIMSQSNYDTKESNLHLPSIENRHSLGSIIDLSFFYPDDTLSPYLEKNYSLSVTYFENDNSEGELVRAIDGTLLDGEQDIHKDYSFKLEKVGAYEVNYIYRDQTYVNGRYNPHTVYGLKVVYSADDVSPTISLDGGYNESTVVNSSLGATHVVKGYQVSDNLDKNVSVDIYLMTPNLNFSKLQGNSFNLNEKGDYRVYYYAKDSSGNVSSIYYTVRVK